MSKKFVAFCLLSLLMLSIVPLTAAQDNVEITFVHIFGGEQDDRGLVVQEIADAFMAENPGITVNVVSTSTDYGEVFNNALLAADQGDAPNIVQVEEGFTQQAADSGYFVPVSDVASEEQLATLEDVLPVIRGYYSIGDVVWSVPWNSSNPLLYYNKGMFEAAGLDPEDPPSTFAEVLAACEAIVEANAELSGCINWPMASWFAEQWVAMQNGLVANNDNGRAARATEMLYTSEEMLNVLNWWKELADAGYYTYSGTINDYNGEGIAFLSQQTAMTINSTAGLALFQRFSAAQGIDLGVAPLPLPTEDATNGVTVGGASVWLMNDQSEEELQASVDFIFFLTNTQNDSTWHQRTGYIPNRVSSIEQLTADGWFDENPAFRIAVDTLSNSQENTATQGAVVGPSAEVRGFLIQAFQSVVDSGADPLEALEAAKAQADEVLADYNSLFE
ncbi:MAG: ABC transporter substrate-binding protein [bacterium]|nr:ABC transporter substrate-binding protein [bacterium]